jgi:TetR/AcrR family transcriptional repressor of mexJK operon
MINDPPDSKKQQIIKAASQMFLTHGYSRVSMDKIAQTAPVSKATLYHYFDSKSALFAAVISQHCTALLTSLNQANTESNSIEHHLSQIANSFVELIYSYEALAMYRLVISESQEFPELSELFYRSGPELALIQLEHYLLRLHKQALFNIEPKIAANLFFSLLKGDTHLQCLLRIRPPLTQIEKQYLIQQALSFYLRGLFQHALT